MAVFELVIVLLLVGAVLAAALALFVAPVLLDAAYDASRPQTLLATGCGRRGGGGSGARDRPT